MTLAFVVQAVRRHLLICLVCLVVMTGAGFAVGSYWPKTYTSHGGILMGLQLKASGMDPQTANTYLKDRVATYAELVTSDEVIQPVADSARLTPEQLRDQVAVAVLPDTVVIDVSVSGATPAQAVELTQAVMDNFSRQVSAFNVETGGPAILLAQVSSPQQATRPDQLNGPVLIAVVSLVGVLLSVLLVVVIALLRVGWSGRARSEGVDQVEIDEQAETDQNALQAASRREVPGAARSEGRKRLSTTSRKWSQS